MKKIFASLIAILFVVAAVNAQGIKWQKNTDGVTFDQVKELAREQNKKIFFDFYTKWCGPCRMMDKEVFPTKEIGDFYNKNFINFKVDAEVGEGMDLRKTYNVKGYPTFIFTDADGNVLKEGSSIGSGDVKGMLKLAKIALGDKSFKEWSWYQQEYENGNRELEFLKAYLDERMVATHMPPSPKHLEELVNAYPESERYSNEESKGIIFWNSIPGNAFYQMLKANKKHFPELKDKQKKISWVNNILMRNSFGGDGLANDEIKSALKKDFPAYVDLGFEFYEIDRMRFSPEAKKGYVDAFFSFIKKHNLPVDMAGFITFSLIEQENPKKEHVDLVLSKLDEGVNSEPPHFFSCASYAYLLAKTGRMKQAQTFAKERTELTASYASSRKSAWGYGVMNDVANGKMPNPMTRGKMPSRMGPMGFPELKFAEIEGAPKLSKPFLVMGETMPVMAEKHGLSAPALWDWNGDGKRDLLIGEFETTSEDHYSDDGSTVRVYLNVGEDNNPRFDDKWQYARDEVGRPLEVNQWCCIGFTPQFVDLDNDGMMDIITGQYHPGDITWFRGTRRGFSPGIKVQQEGDPRAAMNSFHPGFKDADEIETFDYWVYSSANVGDFDGDGDFDLITGGGTGLRISENIGTKEAPRFGRRKHLLDLEGNILKVREYSKEDLKQFEEWGVEPHPAGDVKTSPTVCDWDNDGVLDLLVTNNYRSDAFNAVDFFKGVMTKDGIRFHQRVSLFDAADGGKAFPGSGQRVYVDDWNKDGVNDLIVGASIVTVDGEFHDKMSWEWEDDLDIESAGKDYGRYPDQFKIPSFEEYIKNPWMEGRSKDEQKQSYDTQMAYLKKQLKEWDEKGVPDAPKMIHKGYVYVFLGQK